MANEQVDVRARPEEALEHEQDQLNDMHAQLGYIELRLKAIQSNFPRIGPNDNGHAMIDKLMGHIVGKKHILEASIQRNRVPDEG